MPTVSLVDSAAPLAGDAVVLATVSTDSGVAPAAGSRQLERALGKEFAQALPRALAAVGASGTADEVVKIPTLGLSPAPLIVATGLGKGGNGSPGALDPESVRRAVGAALRALGSARRVAILIADRDDPALTEAICDGALLGVYRFTAYKPQARPSSVRRIDIAVNDPTSSVLKAALRRSRIVTEAVNNVRDLVNTPPNALTPTAFADYAADRGEAAGLAVEVLDERALTRGGFGGILAVGAGAASPPRLVRLSYRPGRAGAGPLVALVGKGVTFDTGGLNLKTAMMAQMKSDMAGAAAVVEAVIAAARLRLPLAVTATVPMAENALSATSYHPSDILTMRNGRRVEIDNTDAEGRLILADAISRAVEDEPGYLIDVATLTGAQMVALGNHTSAVMGSEKFRDQVVAAGSAAGESLWPMPLPVELADVLDSPVADLVNAPKDRWGSMLVAGLFLRAFVPAGLDWAHLDIAGPAFASAASGYTPRGGTGAAVRTILATLTAIAQR